MVDQEDTFIDLSCRMSNVAMRCNANDKEFLSIRNSQFSVDMSQVYNPYGNMKDVDVLVSNRGFNGTVKRSFLFVVEMRPGIVSSIYQLVDAAIQIQRQDPFQSFLYTNDTETPMFLTWCEMRKSKLIQQYGFSYHRHRVGCFCKCLQKE